MVAIELRPTWYGSSLINNVTMLALLTAVPGEGEKCSIFLKTGLMESYLLINVIYLHAIEKLCLPISTHEACIKGIGHFSLVLCHRWNQMGA